MMWCCVEWKWCVFVFVFCTLDQFGGAACVNIRIPWRWHPESAETLRKETVRRFFFWFWVHEWLVGWAVNAQYLPVSAKHCALHCAVFFSLPTQNSKCLFSGSTRVFVYMSVWLLTPSISYSVLTCFSLSTTLRFYEFALTSIFRSPLCLDISIYNCHNFAFHCTVLYCHLYSRKGTEISHHQKCSLNFQFPKCSTTDNTSASSNLLFMR
jgi:hypothetical protein